jgi:hypothetical protein
MKNFLAGILGISLSAVGCVLYVAFYSVILAIMLVVGFTIIGWIF